MTGRPAWLSRSTGPRQRALCVLAGGAALYDPYTSDLMLSGANEILQVQPSKTTFDELASVSVTTTDHLDQNAVDGHGHLFVAGNGGYLHFIDYSQSKLINDAIVLQPQFVKHNLDDIAPMFGNGGPPPNQLPEVTYPVLLLPLLLGLVPVWRRRRAARDRA